MGAFSAWGSLPATPQHGAGGRDAGGSAPTAEGKLLVCRILIRVKLCAAIKTLIIISSICSRCYSRNEIKMQKRRGL